MTEWCKRTEAPHLGLFEIHIWRICLDLPEVDEYQFKNWLSPEEHDRAASFHFIRDRKRFIIRRAMLRHLLASYLVLAPEAVRLLLDLNGKPSIDCESGSSGIRFSCSHSAEWGLIAVSRGHELGVDLEHHRPLTEIEHLAKVCFSSIEIIEFLKMPEAMKTKCFYDIWTRKEALC